MESNSENDYGPNLENLVAEGCDVYLVDHGSTDGTADIARGWLGRGLIGMPDVAGLPRITAALKAAGYSDADVEKIWSGNLFRVMEQAQQAASR